MLEPRTNRQNRKLNKKAPSACWVPKRLKWGIKMALFLQNTFCHLISVRDRGKNKELMAALLREATNPWILYFVPFLIVNHRLAKKKICSFYFKIKTFILSYFYIFIFKQAVFPKNTDCKGQMRRWRAGPRGKQRKGSDRNTERGPCWELSSHRSSQRSSANALEHEPQGQREAAP